MENFTIEKRDARAVGQAQFLARVYGVMSIALLITALTSFLTISTLGIDGIFEFLAAHPFTILVLILAQFGLVFMLAGRINRMNIGQAVTGFTIYSVLVGLTLSIILIRYTNTSIVSTFLVTAGMFGAMCAYGLITKKDLSSWGSILFMGLIGIIIASIVNIFIQSGIMYLIISFVGVVVFTGLTAYDSQKIKESYDGTNNFKIIILGALSLYLDFINLFIYMLRLFGGSRN